MPTLQVKLKVPFECEPPVGSVAALTFSHWLPLQDEHAIRVADDGITLTLWFDEKTTWWASQPTAEELKRHVNVLARYMNVTVDVTEVTPDLAAYMAGRDFSRRPTPEEQQFQTMYEALGAKILSNVLRAANRLISYARAKKGQYWLTEFEFDEGKVLSRFNAFEARGRIDDGLWFRFQPATGEQITIMVGSDSKYITEAEWSEFQQFVTGQRRPPLVGELLAGAEYLSQLGQRRSALTEGVTALEVALYNFARSPKTEIAFGSRMAERLAIPTLVGQVKRLGLSNSIGYLLPAILSEEVMPTEVLRGCQAAITQRHNVVHNGQRDVSEIAIREALGSIRRCCQILESLVERGAD